MICRKFVVCNLILLSFALFAPSRSSGQEWGAPSMPPVGGQVGQASVPGWIVAASVRVSVCSSQGCWLGSGTIFHVDAGRGLAFVLTNHHVVPAERCAIKVSFPGGGTVPATFICTETGPDISIIAVRGDATTPFVPLAEAAPAAGTPVYQVGYPHGHGPVCRAGIAEGPGGQVAGKFTEARFYLDTTQGDSGSGIFRRSDGKLCAVLWGGSGRSSTSAVPVEYVHKMLKDADPYDVIVGVGVLRPRQPTPPQQPAAPATPWSPPASGGPVVTPIAPVQPTAPAQPDPVLTGLQNAVAAIQQDVATAKAALPIHSKAITDLGSQLQQVNQTAAAALAKAGGAQSSASGLQTIVSDVQSKLGQLPQLAGVVSDVQSKLPQLATVLSDVNSKVPAIAAKVEALGTAAGGASTLPLIGAIGGPVGIALGLAALLASLAAKKGATAPAPVTFQLPASVAQLVAQGGAQQQQAA